MLLRARVDCTPGAGQLRRHRPQSTRGGDVAVTSTERPALIADHAVTTGQISQKSFEKVLSPSAMTIGHLKGRGLVVLTSCSHRGVVNAIRQAQAASGVEKIHAVIGGFSSRALSRGIRSRYGQGAPGN